MSIQEDVETLRRVPLFTKVEPAKLKLLVFASERLNYQSGETLFSQGDIADSAYIILDGAVDICINGPHGIVKVAEAGKDSIIGEIGILCDVPRTATIIASTRLMVLKITKELFLQMMLDFPSIAVEITRVLAHRLENANIQLREALRSA